MSKYLVTGGAGFIGSHIVDELVRRDSDVRVLDNMSTGNRENLANTIDRIEFIEGDVRNLATVIAAVKGVDFVLHQAAIASVPLSVTDPVTCNEVNVAGTLNVLVAARGAGVRRVVFASSSSIYGNDPTLPKFEAMPTNPLSPYAVSKQAGESYCRSFYEVYGFPTVALRYFNVFGPRQDPTSQYSAVIPKFITAMIKGEVPTIYGDGTQSRDFIHVSNVVQANLLACERDEAVGRVINVASGHSRSLLDLYHALALLLNVKSLPHFAASHAGDVKDSCAAIEQAIQCLGFMPVVDWEEGLRSTVTWFREMHNQKDSNMVLGTTIEKD